MKENILFTAAVCAMALLIVSTLWVSLHGTEAQQNTQKLQMSNK